MFFLIHQLCDILRRVTDGYKTRLLIAFSEVALASLFYKVKIYGGVFRQTAVHDVLNICVEHIGKGTELID